MAACKERADRRPAAVKLAKAGTSQAGAAGSPLVDAGSDACTGSTTGDALCAQGSAAVLASQQCYSSFAENTIERGDTVVFQFAVIPPRVGLLEVAINGTADTGNRTRESKSDAFARFDRVGNLVWQRTYP